MAKQIKLSTNIERDATQLIEFIPTINSNEVFERIFFNHERGQNSFTLIGSYGTGKSTFLWAFEQHLKGNFYFNNRQVSSISDSFEFERFVGESNSFRNAFCDRFKISKPHRKSNKHILKAFNEKLESINRKGILLVLLVDEFGKHLEYISKNDIDEMYFIQELCEFLNDPLRNVLLITTLHQNISAYANTLSAAQRQEWEKVNGRLLEIPFDEPIEQLLFFAAKKLENQQVQDSNSINKLLELEVLHSVLGPSVSDDKKELYRNIAPLEPLAADIITKALQKYGQNERSLFTFLDSDFFESFKNDENIFSLADCYDFLIKFHFSAIEDAYRNPHKSIWQNCMSLIDKCELQLPSQSKEATAVLKFVCLSSIFGFTGGSFNRAFIVQYFKIVSGFDLELIISDLERLNYIGFSNVKGKYIFKDATDLNLEAELLMANAQVDTNLNVLSRLESILQLKPIIAKRSQYLSGTPRIFKSVLTDYPKDIILSSGIDGICLFLINEDINEKLIQDFSKSQDFPIVIAWVKSVKKIKEITLELEKLDFVKSKFIADKSALKIIHEEIEFNTRKLIEFFEFDLFNSSLENVVWFKNGSHEKVHSAKELNNICSELCLEIYFKSPNYRNEMVNKEYLSTPILTARKQLLRLLIDQSEVVDLGIQKDSFPPEKTIYLSLLKETGIHQVENAQSIFNSPTEKSFKFVWDFSYELLRSSKDRRISIADFYSEFFKSPFRLKKGFLDFWIFIFLVIKKEEYSLYAEDEFVPILTPDILDLMFKTPQRFRVKFMDQDQESVILLNNYKDLVGFNESNIQGIKSSYISIYGNFLRFYRGLDEYSRNTKLLSGPTLSFREAIKKAKDPEEALFELIPAALKKDTKDHNFLEALKEVIRELRTTYTVLIDSLHENLCQHIGIDSTDFLRAKSEVINRFNSVNDSLIANDKLKLFYRRLVSLLDDKTAYYESLSDVILGHKLEKITDDKVEWLKSEIKDYLDSLISFIELHNVDSKSQKLIQYSVISNDGTTNLKNMLELTEANVAESEKLISLIKSNFGSNKQANKLALVKLLSELNND
jgi:hypothetical protein